MRQIRLAPSEPPSLGIDEAKNAANNAYARARAAQRHLVANLRLTELLHRSGMVSIGRLRGELREAQAQVERAQAVRDELVVTVEAIEAGAR